MEAQVPKIRIMIIICLVITSFEVTVGIATLYTGIFYQEFDSEKAIEMLDVIKNTDKNLYAKIINTDDNTYLKEFEARYTTKGNRLLVVYGIMMITFALGCIIPLVILLVPFIEHKNEDPVVEKKPAPAEDEF